MRKVDWRVIVGGALTALLLFGATVHGASADGIEHVVRQGETLRRIAEQYGVSVESLATANRLVNPNLIFVGQVLTVPTTHVGSSEDGGGAASSDEGEDPQKTIVHTVQAGETLTVIAARYGLTTAEILQSNDLTNPNLIFAGQRLTIVGSTTGAPAVEAVPVLAKQIVVDKSEQRAYVYENDNLLWTFTVSTGMPGSETWEGTFAVRSKIQNAYAQLWGLQMPYWLGFYHTGYLENGFHALPIMPSGAVLWDGYLGTPVSFGCVILSFEDAATLFSWADIGTTVVVQP